MERKVFYLIQHHAMNTTPRWNYKRTLLNDSRHSWRHCAGTNCCTVGCSNNKISDL